MFWSRSVPVMDRDGLPGTRIVPGPLRCRRMRQPYEWPPRPPVVLTSADGRDSMGPAWLANPVPCCEAANRCQSVSWQNTADPKVCRPLPERVMADSGYPPFPAGRTRTGLLVDQSSNGARGHQNTDQMGLFCYQDSPKPAAHEGPRWPACHQTAVPSGTVTSEGPLSCAPDRVPSPNLPLAAKTAGSRDEPFPRSLSCD